MHHCEYVVGPARQMTWTTIAVTDESQRSNFLTQGVRPFVVYIPYGHAIVHIAQRVMIRHSRNSAQNPITLPMFKSLNDLSLCCAHLRGHISKRLAVQG